MAKRIVIMAGGTGGHVFPALAVAQTLIEKGWQVSWLGTQKGLEGRVIPEQGIEIDWLSVAGVRGKGWLSKITAVLLLIKACIQAAKILRKRKPDVVLGMGGFVAGPGGLMAKLLGIPLIIHEQNRVPGTTNRLLAGMANQVLEAFPDSFNKKLNARFTGNPLRKQFVECASRRETHPGINILVVGGSQGAQILNEVVPDALVELNGVEVRHQTGTAMQEQVESRYKELGVKAEVNAFIEDMVSAYQWADLVICRSGAMTVSEVAAAGIPAIFIPLPNAIDDHQTANARYLADAGAGLILRQKDLNAATLVEHITKVLKQLDVMSKTAKEHARLDATEVVAGVCMTEAGL
ncbi:undecaprenyldiphospho-muramoylpentapeptide beta-N-acetylglucosaminyltransferase [Methylobacter tundripaludum]|uniref:UDP-N-acetylglucosamine--N-acetylmuramyl-(pentapeptide) pyrophosphoryl-undecaprenol N-acetylglucosamine transferase n=1 Tax=Methylobacter tundripaludum (strain ATCC BAA-1195 / DSM 17260 / SV96) TaxID=697282 RepID=G3IUA1_METTV|nr:undecaprenyldiphospho-muramoylpentapeptide beta-N-acetylglucosaminyltransferase [Methylobacter tundripaludum]EGW22699.1 UDP-N-acetylglucosamine--N-acetylmuramyl-(pentapeptide) pyrophosphoryl-undecaprenol N-acetylglucosamine transferase [Methylobacter tundripaludum SV96]